MIDFGTSTRILGLDVGEKRTGVALSDENRFLSTPLTTIETRDRGVWVNKVIEIIDKEGVGEVVVGLPLNQHGEEGKDAEWVRRYIALLKKRVSLPVVEWDERFTTVQAEHSLIEADLSRKKRKEVIDQVAASITLQCYLDCMRFKSEQMAHSEEE